MKNNYFNFKQWKDKDICGGFFYSTKQVMKPSVTPIG